MTPQSIAAIFAFLVGAVVGSFLNVVIWRVPRGENIAFPASHCPSCGGALRWYHNVPIASWVALRGKCAFCGAAIDVRYPIVELLTAVLAVAVVATFGVNWMAGRAFVLVALLVALTYIDLQHWLLPHALTWPGLAVGLATAWIPGAPGMFDALIGAGAAFGGFWILQRVAEWIFKREALGGGDLFLYAMVGAFLGWQALLPVLFLASLQGSVLGILLLVLNKEEPQATEHVPYEDRDDAFPARSADASESEAAEAPEDEDDWVPPKNAVPFGPFLSLAALEMLFAGDWIIDTTLRLVGLG